MMLSAAIFHQKIRREMASTRNGKIHGRFGEI